MTTKTETIPDVLGKLRSELIERGFKEEQTFQIVLDLIRRGDSPGSVLALG